jgi:erythromycin esterase-like protein
MPHTRLADLVSLARPITNAAVDLDALILNAADHRFVLIGEASHGTHEFYQIRAELTKRLIRDHGFAGVAIEGDWPDAYRVNRYVRGDSRDADATEALAGFTRFPQWMWRNADVLDFVGWLRDHNERHPRAASGFYGLDLYSLHASIDAVLDYLRRVDPDAATRAARRYACFDHFGRSPEEYGYVAARHDESCEGDVIAQLVEMRMQAAEYATRDGTHADDDQFFAEQNAKVVVNAERYYRTMYAGGRSSWNLRDQHMAETLDALANFLDARQSGAKLVVWAHNSHLGDARATEMGAQGELNLGQLTRESHGDAALLVGLTTYHGSVTAASDWDHPVERKSVRPGLPDSWESLLHETGLPRFWLDLREADVAEQLHEPRLERAIGVIYRPETERMSHYFHARLASQFDAVIHIDRTQALAPLERTTRWARGSDDELPETYPSAL